MRGREMKKTATMIALLVVLATNGCTSSASGVRSGTPEDFGPAPDARILIERWLAANLNDPASLQDLTVSPVQKFAGWRGLINGGGWWYAWSACARYRAANSYGGLVIENRTFIMRGDQILNEWNHCTEET
jgi:hypothetical protein